MKKYPSITSAVGLPAGFVGAALLAGCMVMPPPVRVSQPFQPAPPQSDYSLYGTYGDYTGEQGSASEQVVGIYDEPALYQPPPVRVEWAPPPMLVEPIPPQPYPDAAWTGGYWVWRGDWVWAHGRWAPPPRPRYRWVNPYYEHRGDSVIFVNGFWAAPEVVFVRPAPNIRIDFARVNSGVRRGPRPSGPDGVFVPPPPGSRRGLIVPAPLGTAPAVVISAPPVVREGMRIRGANDANRSDHRNDGRRYDDNANNGPRVTIVAPANATANGQSVNASVPSQAHLAGALPSVVRAAAPEPAAARSNVGSPPLRPPQQPGQPVQQPAPQTPQQQPQQQPILQPQRPQQFQQPSNGVRPFEAPSGLNRPPAPTPVPASVLPPPRPPLNAASRLPDPTMSGQERWRAQDGRNEAPRQQAAPADRPAHAERPPQPERPVRAEPPQGRQESPMVRERVQPAQAPQPPRALPARRPPEAAARQEAPRERERPAGPRNPKEDGDDRKRHERN